MQWLPIGISGEKIARVVYDLLHEIDPALQANIRLTNAYCDRATGEVKFEDTIDDEQFGERPVLLIDSAVHSGMTMNKVSKKLWEKGVKNIISYSLMLKRTSIVIPNFFGIVVADKDRVYFQLDEVPNNRLCENPPFGILREVTEDDIGREIGDIGPPFEDDLSIGGLLYDKDTKNYHPYIYEHMGNIAGVLSFGKAKRVLFVDAWATMKSYRGKGIGDALLRWAETWARSNKCDVIELWAYSAAIPIYEHYGYEFVGNKEMKLAADRTFRLMGKKILYNTKLSGHWP